MKIRIKVIVILILIVAICILGYLTMINFNDILDGAYGKANRTDVDINKMIEETISVCSVEYDYDEIITRNQTWGMGLNPSIAAAKFIGKIKV